MFFEQDSGDSLLRSNSEKLTELELLSALRKVTEFSLACINSGLRTVLIRPEDVLIHEDNSFFIRTYPLLFAIVMNNVKVHQKDSVDASYFFTSSRNVNYLCPEFLACIGLPDQAWTIGVTIFEIIVST